MQPFEVIEHTADVFIIAYGRSLEELFANAAVGMMSFLIDLASVRLAQRRTVTADADDRGVAHRLAERAAGPPQCRRVRSGTIYGAGTHGHVLACGRDGGTRRSRAAPLSPRREGRNLPYSRNQTGWLVAGACHLRRVRHVCRYPLRWDKLPCWT